MKRKADFVTNSSSSSFIVIWPCKIKTSEDVSRYIPRDDFCSIIFGDAVKQKGPKLNSKVLPKLIRELCAGYVDGITGHYDYEKIFCKREGIQSRDLWENHGWQKQCWEEAEIHKKDQAKKKAEELIEGNVGYVYFFEYGDESGGIYAELEHDNDWGHLPGIRISRH